MHHLDSDTSFTATWRGIRRLSLLLALAACCLPSCNRVPAIAPLTSQDSLRITGEILDHRKEADAFFREDRNSPFMHDTSAHFDSIKWFPPNLKYYFRSALYRYPHPQPVVVFGTKGEKRNSLKYGYFKIDFEGSEHRLNVYKTLPSDNDSFPDTSYLSVWFTDATTGKETYGVGRYVDVGEEHPDPAYVYVVDMNKAYNPYCAYSAAYSCAIPRKEDHFDFPVPAGEMKYHR